MNHKVCGLGSMSRKIWGFGSMSHRAFLFLKREYLSRRYKECSPGGASSELCLKQGTFHAVDSAKSTYTATLQSRCVYNNVFLARVADATKWTIIMPVAAIFATFTALAFEHESKYVA